jgi:hydroxyacylglutathione hydrolase
MRVKIHWRNMIIERLWPANAWRNYHYLIACEETGEALAVDPLDWALCERTARERGWTITQILNTHEHGDHIGGNEPLRAATGARVLAHAGASDRIAGVDRGLKHGDLVKVGRSVELECLDTPGHTRSHLCLLMRGRSTHAPPELLCGDTLFNAGAGNCHNGGDPELLYLTFVQRLAPLPDATRIHPGHDYLARNLAFTLNREPNNRDAADLLSNVQSADGARAPVTTLRDERRINTFFRLQNPTVIEGLRKDFPDLPDQPDPKTIFLKLRELRNRW